MPGPDHFAGNAGADICGREYLIQFFIHGKNHDLFFFIFCFKCMQIQKVAVSMDQINMIFLTLLCNDCRSKTIHSAYNESAGHITDLFPIGNDPVAEMNIKFPFFNIKCTAECRGYLSSRKVGSALHDLMTGQFFTGLLFQIPQKGAEVIAAVYDFILAECAVEI